VLAALRESVVLYAQVMLLGKVYQPPVFEWRVDEELARQANRFIHAFNALFSLGTRLPAATAENAAAFSGGFDVKKIMGRCVRVGYARHARSRDALPLGDQPIAGRARG